MKKVAFKNRDGGLLSARLELPTSQRPVSYAVFAHCFTCNKNLAAVRNIARALNQKGIAVSVSYTHLTLPTNREV